MAEAMKQNSKSSAERAAEVSDRRAYRPPIPPRGQYSSARGTTALLIECGRHISQRMAAMKGARANRQKVDGQRSRDDGGE
jgi:hypothetical protein